MMRLVRIALAAIALPLLGAGYVLVQAAPLPDPPPCTNCFVGKVILSLYPADPSGRRKVLEDDLYFVDPDGLVWKANKGDITDGASIPALAQVIVGNAFENDFLPAAIIHDRYTHIEHQVRDWRDVAKMFYQAMLANGVDAAKAKTMYYAVYVFGPHWGHVQGGTSCGRNCINDSRPGLSVWRESEADYSNSALVADVKSFQDRIDAAEKSGAPLSLEQIQDEARARHPGDAFIAPSGPPGRATE